MSSCPEEPTPQTCGLAAVQFLAAGRHVVLEPYDQSAPIKLGKAAGSVMEVLNPRSVTGNGLYDVATFGCAACDRCVQIIDDNGDLLAKLAE